MQPYLTYHFQKVSINNGEVTLGATDSSDSRAIQPAASVAKLYIAGAVFSEIDHNIVSLNEHLGNSTVRDLITRMLTIIDNRAAALLVEKIGRNTFKDYIRQWKLGHTTPYDPDLNPISTTSPEDAVNFIIQLLTNQLKLSKNSQDMLLDCMSRSEPHFLVTPKGYKLFQKTGEGISLRRNFTLFNCAGLMMSKDSTSGVTFCMMSRFNGFWNRRRQLRMLNKQFESSLQKLKFLSH